MQENWILNFARLGPVGKLSRAQGTAASFVALIAAPLIFMPLPIVGRLVVLAVLFWIGNHACTYAEEALEQKDPPQVVIDEVFGQWLTLMPFLSLGFFGYIVAFGFFRLFDIWKPWPACDAEQLAKGFGIMADDAIAAVYAIVCTAFVLWIF